MIERVHVPNVRSKPNRGAKGIIIVGLMPEDEFPGMLLIWDEGAGNTGASATNCMATLLFWVSKNWPDFPIKTDIVIQRDSSGFTSR